MSHHDSHSHRNTGDIKIAFFLNLGFTILEIVGGLWTNSAAILSDALHDLGDSLSLGLAWFLGNYAERSQDERYSYGYRRYSLLGALANTLILIGGSIFVLSEAIPRLLQPERPYAPGMAVIAVAGIVVNGLAALRVQRSPSLNVQTVAWHLLEDVLGWVAVLLVSIILLFANVPVLDPILSVLITVYVLYNVIRNLKKTSALFLQAVPEEVNLTEIERRLQEISAVCSTHHTHAWSLDGEHHVLTTHVVVNEDVTRDDVLRIKSEVKALVDSLENFEHVTVEIEYSDEACRMNQEKVT
ncbi:MAG TPA: cation diffusion facilitator family transporter [Anaerolineae bacterium]